MFSSILRKSILVSLSILFWFALNGQTSNGISIVTHNVGPFAQANSKQFIYGAIENFSTEIVENIQVAWQVNNGDIYVDTYSNLNLGNWTKYIFEHKNQWSVGNEGEYTFRIWVDKVNGQSIENSDTLSIPVKALTQTAKRTVLLESFTSIDCASCASLNPSIREISQKFRENSFTIAYQIDCYSNNPMCILAENDIFERVELYNIVSTPFLLVNNWYRGNSSEYLDFYFNAELERPSPIDISGNFSISNNQIGIECTISPFTPLSTENLVLKVAYIEDIVSFDSPPGGNGESEFFHILRKFSSVQTNIINPLANGENIQLIFNEDFTGFNVDLTKFRVAVFLQDTSTLEVIQTAELTPLQTGIGLKDSPKINIYPNPTHNGIFVSLEEIPKTSVMVKLIDPVGKVTYETKIDNSLSFEIPTKGLSSGVYILWLIGPDFNSKERVVIY